MLTTILLYGKLRARFGREFRLNVKSPAEAVRALSVLLPGFERYMRESKVEYAVFVGKRNIGVEELHDPSGNEPIRIAPFTKGAKKNGVVQTIVGIVLIVVGVILSPYSGGSSTTLSKVGAGMVSAGIGLAAGGIVQMLTPMSKPKQTSDRGDSVASSQFSGPVNVQAQGNVVPLCYGGPIVIGSAVISASIESKDGVYIPLDTSLSNNGGGSANWTNP